MFFYLPFANSIFTLNLKKKIVSYFQSLLNLCDEYHFKNIKDCHKIGKKISFSNKFNFTLNQLDALVFFLFHTHNQKPKQNHQLYSSRAKTRSTQSQACVKYRGNIICIKRNTDVSTGDQKKQKIQRNVQIRLISRHYL